MSKVYKNDVGTVISLNVGEDVSTATVTNIKYRKPEPSNTTGTWVATISGEEIYYATTSGDLNVSGTWKLQSSVTIEGWTGLGETVDLEVYPLYG